MFEMNTGLQWIISIGLIAYVGYSLFKTGKEFREYRKNSKEYLAKHKDAKEEHYGIWQCTLLVIMTIACLGMALFAQLFSVDESQLLLYRVAYLCIGILFVGLMMEMWIHRSIIFTEDGFFIGTRAYRYRMITTLEKSKGIIKTIRVLFQNGDVIQVSLKIGELIRVRYNEFKAIKKEKKEKRRRR